MAKLMKTLAAVLIVAIMVHPATAREAIPNKVGTCATTSITSISGRFSPKIVRPTPQNEGDGTVVNFKIKTGVISYEFVEQVYNSKVGDAVIVCLISIPSNCPKGDNRGRYYTTTNLRTLESWTLMDSPHGCGGA